MDVFLASISTEDYESMASALIQMGATNNDVNSVAFARDLQNIFSSIKESWIFFNSFHWSISANW